MAKLDLKKDLKELYTASAKAPALVDAPPLSFLMVDGSGDPGTAPEFQAGIESLYGLAYTLKFLLKKRGGSPEYAVMPLQGLWWADDMTLFSESRKDLWHWTLMIAQPDFVTPEQVREATAERIRKKGALPALGKVRLERYEEGPCAQILHIGPYSAEKPTIERLHAFIKEQGFQLRGKHHEVYLGDPRRTEPENLQTIIRQPIQKEL